MNDEQWREKIEKKVSTKLFHLSFLIASHKVKLFPFTPDQEARLSGAGVSDSLGCVGGGCPSYNSET